MISIPGLLPGKRKRPGTRLENHDRFVYAHPFVAYDRGAFSIWTGGKRDGKQCGTIKFGDAGAVRLSVDSKLKKWIFWLSKSCLTLN